MPVPIVTENHLSIRMTVSSLLVVLFMYGPKQICRLTDGKTEDEEREGTHDGVKFNTTLLHPFLFLSWSCFSTTSLRCWGPLTTQSWVEDAVCCEMWQFVKMPEGSMLVGC